nr:MAG TPA: hypothetical protein [Caudoviricetes sp.]
MNSKNSVPYGNTASSDSFRPAVLTKPEATCFPREQQIFSVVFIYDLHGI